MMANPLIELYAILNRFTEPAPFIEKTICEKISNYPKERNLQINPKLNPELFYEKIAFSLIERNQPSNLQGWEGLYYGPNDFILMDKDNSITSSDPNIRDISLEMINYWEKRSNEVNIPIVFENSCFENMKIISN